MHATCSDSWVFVHADMLLIDDYLWECLCPVELATRCPLPIQTSVETFGLPFRSVVETTGDVILGAKLPTNPQYIDVFQSISPFTNPSLDEQWVWHGDFTCSFILQTDASEHGVGAVLSQCDDDGQEHPIAYFSRKLLPQEEHYSTIEKECLAIKLGVQAFRVYLLGSGPDRSSGLGVVGPPKR